MADRLKDRIAIVVGAGSSGPGWGNGKCTAITFAREGAQVPPGRQGDRIWREIPPRRGLEGDLLGERSDGRLRPSGRRRSAKINPDLVNNQA